MSGWLRRLEAWAYRDPLIEKEIADRQARLAARQYEATPTEQLLERLRALAWHLETLPSEGKEKNHETDSA